MKKDDHISEEQLNAFIDGELDSEEKSNLFDAAEKSAELDQRLCQQRKLKELVKHAYLDVPEPHRLLNGQGRHRSLLNLAMVATLLLIVGSATGYMFHGFLERGSHQGDSAARTTAQTGVSAQNYILHIVSGEPEKMRLVLQEAHSLLSAAEPGSPRKVEVVATERGLNLLRSDVTLFSEEIRALSDENVVFYACSKAVERLEERGVVVQLVPEAVAGFTALDRVVSRMQAGWHYVKI